MIVLSLLTAAVAPGLCLLFYFYLKDRYDAEPVHMVAKMFFLGAIIVFPTMVLQRALVLGFGENPILYSFVYAAGIEEFCKWFILYFVLFKNVIFDEPYDGIVYSVAVASGFATMENIFYAFLNHPSFFDLLLRGILPVSGHALFGVTMGYYLGEAKFHPTNDRKYLFVALLIPLLYHGIFDYILLVNATWVWMMVPLMIFLWVRSLWKVKKANNKSSLRHLPLEDEVRMSTTSP